jgi:SAM-dependent methyltransferase
MTRTAAAGVPACLVELLRCPRCGAAFDAPGGARAALECRRCGHQVAVVGGVPRFVQDVRDETARRTQASFGYEWTHFADWQPSGATNFADYFAGLDLASLRGALVLDAGCGMGRHARQIAPFAGRVIAVDFSRAIDQAARNTAECPNVACVQADLLALPLAERTFDFVYSLGVLHHLGKTERALAGLVRLLKPGGRLRVYLYWKRHGWSGALLRGVACARRLTTRLPFPALRVLCWILSVGLYGGIVLPYRVLARAGVETHASWPLFVYTKYPFAVLYNDQFDRFSAPLEKRYDPGDVHDLLFAAGLRDIQVRPCFGWVAEGVKPL